VSGYKKAKINSVSVNVTSFLLQEKKCNSMSCHKTALACTLQSWQQCS